MSNAEGAVHCLTLAYSDRHPAQPGTRWEEPAVPAQPPDDDAGDFTLRQLVERFAAENGLTFMPKYGRAEAGLQVRLLPRSLEEKALQLQPSHSCVMTYSQQAYRLSFDNT